jgi:hypothetical protein
VPPRPRITAEGGTSRRVRIPLRRSGTFGVSRTDTGLRGEVKPVAARRSCSLSRTRPRRLQRSGALPEILTHEPRATVRENGHNSHGVLRLYSTCGDRESGSRIDPASPPAGFPVYPPGSYVTHDPTRRGGSASEVCPSEVFPFADQSPVSGSRPSCRWNRVAPRLQGSLRRRSVGAGTPRSSPGILASRAFNLATRRGPSRAAVPSCASPAPSPKGGDRRRSKVCSATRSACLSRDSVPSWPS